MVRSDQGTGIHHSRAVAPHAVCRVAVGGRQARHRRVRASRTATRIRSRTLERVGTASQSSQRHVLEMSQVERRQRPQGCGVRPWYRRRARGCLLRLPGSRKRQNKSGPYVTRGAAFDLSSRVHLHGRVQAHAQHGSLRQADFLAFRRGKHPAPTDSHTHKGAFDATQ